MTRYGLFIDYEFCSGCKACVTACKMEHGFEPGDFGIVLLQDGPRECSDGKWEYNGTGITMSSEIINADLFYASDGALMYRDHDDPEDLIALFPAGK